MRCHWHIQGYCTQYILVITIRNRREERRVRWVAGGNLRSTIRDTDRDERIPILDGEGEGNGEVEGVGSSSSRWVFGGNLRSTQRDTV